MLLHGLTLKTRYVKEARHERSHLVRFRLLEIPKLGKPVETVDEELGEGRLEMGVRLLLGAMERL